MNKRGLTDTQKPSSPTQCNKNIANHEFTNTSSSKPRSRKRMHNTTAKPSKTKIELKQGTTKTRNRARPIHLISSKFSMKHNNKTHTQSPIMITNQREGETCRIDERKRIKNKQNRKRMDRAIPHNTKNCCYEEIGIELGWEYEEQDRQSGSRTYQSKIETQRAAHGLQKKKKKEKLIDWALGF